MTPPLVSVVIPTFNRAYCVCRTIDSALTQTHSHLELLVVDDGSTDDTRQVIQRRYSSESRVKYIHQENTGVSGARNNGLQAAQGDCIALLDSDDVWKPYKLELQLAVLRRLPEVGMVWTDMEAIDPRGNVFSPRYIRQFYSSYRLWRMSELFSRQFSVEKLALDLPADVAEGTVYAGDIYSQMVVGNLVHTSTVLLRRERMEQTGLFNETYKTGEDYDFHLRTTRAGPVAFVDVPALQYQRGLADRLTRPEMRIHMARGFLNTLEATLARDRDRIRLPRHMLDLALSDAHGWVGDLALSSGDREVAQQQLSLSLKYRWWQPRIAALWMLSHLPQLYASWIRSSVRALKFPFCSQATALQ